MAARTGARTGLSPPALASDSSALDHLATEGTIISIVWATDVVFRVFRVVFVLVRPDSSRYVSVFYGTSRSYSLYVPETSGTFRYIPDSASSVLKYAWGFGARVEVQLDVHSLERGSERL